MDPLEILGLSPGATPEQIKAAYRRAVKAFHPDSHPDDPKALEKMHQINQAYEKLTRPKKALARKATRPQAEPAWKKEEEGKKEREKEGEKESQKEKEWEASEAAPEEEDEKEKKETKRPSWARRLLLLSLLLLLTILGWLFLSRTHRPTSEPGSLLRPQILTGAGDLSLLVGQDQSFPLQGARTPVTATFPSFLQVAISGNVVTVKSLSEGEGEVTLVALSQNGYDEAQTSFHVSSRRQSQSIRFSSPVTELQLREGQVASIEILGVQTRLGFSLSGAGRVRLRARRGGHEHTRLFIEALGRGFADLRLRSSQSQAFLPSNILTLSLAVLPAREGLWRARSPLVSSAMRAIHSPRTLLARRFFSPLLKRSFPRQATLRWQKRSTKREE